MSHKGSGPETAVTITLPYPPSANRYWRHCRGMTFVSPEARRYRAAVAVLARGLVPFGGDVAVTLRVYRPAKRGDLDNTQKVLLDALRGFAFDDDKQVVEIHAHRFDDKHNPRVEVTVESVVSSTI